LFQVKLKALTIEEKDVNFWWDLVHDIGKVYRMYERTLVKMANGFQSNEKLNQIEHKKLTSLVKMTNVL
jgi:hypothetical protein